jgi:hypothetical protein
MANKQQDNIRNPFQTMLSLFLLSVGAFWVLMPPSNTAALDCLKFNLESHTHYRFIDSKYYNRLQHFHDAICKRVEDGRWERDKASEAMNSIVMRYGICRDNRINPNFEEYVKKELMMPDSVVLAHKQFCQDTYDPSRWDRMKIKGLVDRVDWLRVEIFCQWTHEVANPSGFWIQLFKPDVPSQKKFEERTDTICQELRTGKITYNDAYYRWQQAVLEAQKRLGPEAVKEIGKSLKEPMKALVDLFKNTAK